MKKPLSFLLFFLLSNLFVQAQNTLITGLTYVNFGKDGQRGVGYYTEYNHALNPAFSLAPSIQMAYGTKGQEFPYYLLNKFTTGLDLNLFYTPIHLGKAGIRIGIGPSLRYFSGRDRSYFGISDNYSGISGLGPDGTYWVPYFYPNDRLKPNYFSIGYSGVIEGNLNLSSHWQSGLRASYQNYESHEYILTVGLNMGYHF